MICLIKKGNRSVLCSSLYFMKHKVGISYFLLTFTQWLFLPRKTLKARKCFLEDFFSLKHGDIENCLLTLWLYVTMALFLFLIRWKMWTFYYTIISISVLSLPSVDKMENEKRKLNMLLDFGLWTFGPWTKKSPHSPLSTNNISISFSTINSIFFYISACFFLLVMVN